jgi:hypothetical protein
VLHVLQGQQRLAENFVRRLPFARRYPPDAARIVTDLILIEEIAGAHNRPTVQHWRLVLVKESRPVGESGRKTDPTDYCN